MTELADTSAWVVSRRAGSQSLRASFDGLVESDLIATCDMIRLELLYSARDGEEFGKIESRFRLLQDVPIDKPVWERAIWVYRRLAEQEGAHQRAVGHEDLLIAAAAEGAELRLLHYDGDFDRIAEITGQPTRWVAARGSI